MQVDHDKKIHEWMRKNTVVCEIEKKHPHLQIRLEIVLTKGIYVYIYIQFTLVFFPSKKTFTFLQTPSNKTTNQMSKNQNDFAFDENKDLNQVMYINLHTITKYPEEISRVIYRFEIVF